MSGLKPLLAPAARLDRPLHGIGFVLVAASVFPMQDVIVKGLSGRYPALQIVFVRSLIALSLYAWLLWRERGVTTFPLQRPWLHAGRGALGLVSFTSYYMAIAALPLATVTAVAFAAPLFVTVLSARVLREPVDRQQLARRAGRLRRRARGVAARGGGVRAGRAPGPAVGAHLRDLADDHARARPHGFRREHRVHLDPRGVDRGRGCPGSSPGARDRGADLHPSIAFLVRGWALPSWGEFGLMILCGFISAVGMYCFTQGYRVAPASTVAPFEYVMIGWSALWGYVFWGDVPGPSTLVGVAATVAAGVYVLQHQARAQRARRAAARAAAG